LKDRGAELETAIGEIFPKAMTQLCLTHQMRNSLNQVRPKDKSEIASDLKAVYQIGSLPAAKQKLLGLQVKLKSKYPRLLNRWFDSLESLMRFLEFPKYLQPHLYSTNRPERLNKDFRKVLKNKNSTPIEDSVRNLFVAHQVDLNVLWQKYYRKTGDADEGAGKEFTQGT